MAFLRRASRRRRWAEGPRPALWPWRRLWSLFPRRRPEVFEPLLPRLLAPPLLGPPHYQLMLQEELCQLYTYQVLLPFQDTLPFQVLSLYQV